MLKVERMPAHSDDHPCVLLRRTIYSFIREHVQNEWASTRAEVISGRTFQQEVFVTISTSLSVGFFFSCFSGRRRHKRKGFLWVKMPVLSASRKLKDRGGKVAPARKCGERRNGKKEGSICGWERKEKERRSSCRKGWQQVRKLAHQRRKIQFAHFCFLLWSRKIEEWGNKNSFSGKHREKSEGTRSFGSCVPNRNGQAENVRNCGAGSARSRRVHLWMEAKAGCFVAFRGSPEERGIVSAGSDERDWVETRRHPLASFVFFSFSWELLAFWWRCRAGNKGNGNVAERNVRNLQEENSGPADVWLVYVWSLLRGDAKSDVVETQSE